MQNCTIVGNITRITNVKDTSKVYVVVADHELVKKEGGGFEQVPNYVTLEGFVPTGLKLEVGMLLGATFKVRTYKTKQVTKDGKPIYKTANDVINWDLTLRSPAKKATNGQPEAEPSMAMDEAAAMAAEAAMADVPASAGVPIAE